MGLVLAVPQRPDEHLRDVKDVTNLKWKPEGGKSVGEVGAAIQKDLRVAPPMNVRGATG